MTKFVVLCPAAKSGGPEALHQLVDAMHRQGAAAAICYISTSRGLHNPILEKPEAYRHYAGAVIALNEIRREDHLIIPETLAHYCAKFRSNTFSLWWLSINNFNGWLTLISRSTDMRSRLRVVKMLLKSPSQFKATNSSVQKAQHHFVQSAYAENILRRTGSITNIFPLSDYVSVVHTFEERTAIGLCTRLSIVTNGRKGILFQKIFSMMAPSLPVLQLKGLSSLELEKALRRSDVYIDFGHQPGKDRLPREAALLGNVIYVRRKGAGKNSVDVPIPDSLKFRCSLGGLLSLKRRLKQLSTESMIEYRDLLSSYVSWIVEERMRFDVEVCRAVEQVTQWKDGPR